MNKVKDFDSFMNESQEDIDPTLDKHVAGIAITWENKILVVHPTNGSWQNSAYGIPKGGIEKGEEHIDAAIRELREETGIIVRPSDLDLEIQVANHFGKDGKVKSQLIYFTMNIDSPSQIGLEDHRVPKTQLQLEEVDWAGFIDIDKVYSKMHRSQMIILDRLR
jgi:8-oxo-dGTP pyrophosphatase MutT (NUDIX family)